MHHALLAAWLLFGFPISGAPEHQSFPQAVSADGLFQVFWEDERFAGEEVYSIYGARVTRAGSVLDPAGRQVFANRAECAPAAAAGPAGLLVVLQDHGRGLLTDHGAGDVGVAGHECRHDGGVRHP